jgi:hypothetical protein
MGRRDGTEVVIYMRSRKSGNCSLRALQTSHRNSTILVYTAVVPTGAYKEKRVVFHTATLRTAKLCEMSARSTNLAADFR